MTMRVGIDARCLSRQLTGIGYYTLNVVTALDQHAIETVLLARLLFVLMSHPIDIASLLKVRIETLFCARFGLKFIFPIYCVAMN